MSRVTFFAFCAALVMLPVAFMTGRMTAQGKLKPVAGSSFDVQTIAVHSPDPEHPGQMKCHVWRVWSIRIEQGTF